MQNGHSTGTLILAIILFSFIALAVGGFFGLMIGASSSNTTSSDSKTNQNSTANVELASKNTEITNLNSENSYLSDSACKLYDNYKNLYLGIDSECNANASCRGSAT